MLLARRFFNDDFFDDLFDFDFPFAGRFNAPISRYSRSFPIMNIYEDDSNYYISAELPGVKKSDLKIAVSGDILSIECKRETKTKEKSDAYYRAERIAGEFKRSVSLSESIDKDKISAELKNGVLLITLGKSEEIKPRAIEVK